MTVMYGHWPMLLPDIHGWLPSQAQRNTSTKLYCWVTEAEVCIKDMLRVITWRCDGRISNLSPLDLKSNILTITPTSHTITVHWLYLLVQIPYSSSTKAMLRLRRRKRKRFLESLSEKISLHNNRKIQNNVVTRSITVNNCCEHDSLILFWNMFLLYTGMCALITLCILQLIKLVCIVQWISAGLLFTWSGFESHIGPKHLSSLH